MPARVLLIDDDPGLSEVIELLLSREGYGVERAGTLKAGIARSGAAGIDLVITDLKLPDGTGLDAIREIRGVHPALPIILITSYSSMESAIGALRAGAVDYLIKPFDNDEFLHAVARELVDRKSTRLNSSHPSISYAVFCLKKKKNKEHNITKINIYYPHDIIND